MNRNLQTTETPAPTEANPVPRVTNPQLYASLLGAGYLADRMAAAGITKEALPDLRRLAVELAASLTPADGMEIAALVERSLNHYPRADLNDLARENRLEDWYDDLSDVPADALRAAFRDYRRSTARFAPTPGQILELARRYDEAPRVGLQYARKAIERLEAT